MTTTQWGAPLTGAQMELLRAGQSSQRIISALVQGLHAQVFGVHALGDPNFSHAALADGGQLHEAIHALVEALPPSAAFTTPDEIVKELEAQAAEIARLREALEFYAKDHVWPNEGPWVPAAMILD